MPGRIAFLTCSRLASASELSSPPGLVLRPVRLARDARDIARLGDALAAAPGARSSVSAAAPRPRGRGLVAELAGRPGREVEAWLVCISAHDPARELVGGLISLVTCRSAVRIRHSIGWVLVHPAARRRGVARALVATACRRAAELAAQTVWVECRSDWVEAMAFWRAVGFEERRRDPTAATEARQPLH